MYLVRYKSLNCIEIFFSHLINMYIFIIQEHKFHLYYKLRSQKLKSNATCIGALFLWHTLTSNVTLSRKWQTKILHTNVILYIKLLSITCLIYLIQENCENIGKSLQYVLQGKDSSSSSSSWQGLSKRGLDRGDRTLCQLIRRAGQRSNGRPEQADIERRREFCEIIRENVANSQKLV